MTVHDSRCTKLCSIHSHSRSSGMVINMTGIRCRFFFCSRRNSKGGIGVVVTVIAEVIAAMVCDMLLIKLCFYLTEFCW